MTPRLPESTSGFTTQGYVAQRASSAAPSRSRGTTSKRGTGNPAARSRSRESCLLRAAATASGGLWGRPSRSAASAATSAVRSSTPTTAAGPSGATARASSSAAAPASRNLTVSGESSQPAASWWQTSLTGTTSTPSFCAAARKSSLR